MIRKPDTASLIVLALGLTVGSGLLYGAQFIQPPIFDPVGSAALPQACAVALIALALGEFLAQFSKQHPDTGVSKDTVEGFDLITATVAILMIAYIGLMQLGLGFEAATLSFVMAAIPVIGRSFRLLAIAVIIAALLAFGAAWLFSTIFFVDLPKI